MRFARAIGFSVLLVVAAVGALALGERIREARTPPTGNALAAQKSPSPSPAPIGPAPVRSLIFPPGYVPGSARVAPDGRSLVVPSSDWKRFAMFDVPLDDAPLVLRGSINPAGGEWLPDGSGYVFGEYLTTPAPRNADGAVSTMKQQRFSVFERDGSVTAIGTGWMRSGASPDSRWVPVIDDCCPSTIRLLSRHGGTSQALVRLRPDAGSTWIVGWDPGGRLLYSEAGRLFAADLAGAVAEIRAPFSAGSTERSYSYVGRSPDGTAVVLQVNGTSSPQSFAITRSGVVPIAPVFSDSWVGPHDILAMTKEKFLAVDTSTGAERGLPIAKPPRDTFVGASGPYLLWREDATGPLHVSDARTGADRLVDVPWTPAGAQRLDNGRFFLPSDTTPGIFDAAAWLSRTVPFPRGTTA